MSEKRPVTVGDRRHPSRFVSARLGFGHSRTADRFCWTHLAGLWMPFAPDLWIKL